METIATREDCDKDGVPRIRATDALNLDVETADVPLETQGEAALVNAAEHAVSNPRGKPLSATAALDLNMVVPSRRGRTADACSLWGFRVYGLGHHRRPGPSSRSVCEGDTGVAGAQAAGHGV